MNRCKTLTPRITWESALLLPTRHKRNTTDSKQPESVSPSKVMEGSGQLVTHPLLSLPPHRYFPTIQVLYQAVNPGGIITLRRHPKMGWNRRLQWKQLSSLHTKEIIKGHWGAESKYIPSDLFYFLSTIFHFQPQPFHTIVLIFIVGWGIFFP